MPVDPTFIRTNQIYEQNASEARKRIGRRLNTAEAQRVWLQSAEQARQEAVQQQQHEAATIDALEDLRRGASDLFSAANDEALFAADQHDDMMQWRWSIGDFGL